MLILESALKHGISKQDIQFVYWHVINSLVLRSDPEKVMLFGFDTIDRGLEIGYVVNDKEEDIVFHAMKVRSVYKIHLYGPKGQIK